MDNENCELRLTNDESESEEYQKNLVELWNANLARGLVGKKGNK